MTSARLAIRAGTADDHERLDQLFEGFDLADRDAYGHFLIAHARALPPVEAAIDAAGAAAWIPGWAHRRRAAAITADLAALRLAPPPPAAYAPLVDEAECWGAAYVVEGSRLGGALLARRVAADLPRTYLAAAQAKGAWAGFVSAMDAALGSAEGVVRATVAARRTFNLFAAAGREQLELSAK
jgi:heme oxygenase